jgi:uncharacterized membrane protein YgdD (TMEM256/DUF423 family)
VSYADDANVEATTTVRVRGRKMLHPKARGHYISRMDRIFLMIGAVSAAISVGAGAFGAHALKDRLEPRLLEVFETAARYQMYHALALLAVGAVINRWPSSWATSAGWLFLAGTLFFSGSLYTMAFTGVRALGAITPIGGVCFIAGWLCLAMAAAKAS